MQNYAISDIFMNGANVSHEDLQITNVFYCVLSVTLHFYITFNMLV